MHKIQKIIFRILFSASVVIVWAAFLLQQIFKNYEIINLDRGVSSDINTGVLAVIIGIAFFFIWRDDFNKRFLVVVGILGWVGALLNSIAAFGNSVAIAFFGISIFFLLAALSPLVRKPSQN